MQDWHACGRRSSVGGGVIVSGFGRPPRCDHWPKSGRSHEVTYFSFRTNRAFSSACGSATVMAPVPMTLIAFRFFDPQTAPKPPWPAPLPASCTRHPCAVWFSPAGPMHSTAGGCVESVSPRSFAASRHACWAVFPRAWPVCSQIACWAAHVSLPHTPAASWNVTRSLAISTHVGLAALPVMTMASQPAYFSIVEKRPPNPERVYQLCGCWPTPTPTTSQRPPADGAMVPLSGDVQTQTTLAGLRPSLIVLSLQKSQKSAEPRPWPPPHRRYFSVGTSFAFPADMSRWRILPAYPCIAMIAPPTSSSCRGAATPGRGGSRSRTFPRPDPASSA